MKNHPSESSSISVREYAKAILFGLLVGFCVSLLMLFLSAWVMTSMELPQPMVTMLAIFSAGLGGFFAGLVSAKISCSKGLLMGLACGLILSVVILIAGFSFLRHSMGVLILLKLVVIIAASCIGGIIGVNGKKRRRKS